MVNEASAHEGENKKYYGYPVPCFKQPGQANNYNGDNDYFTRMTINVEIFCFSRVNWLYLHDDS